MPDSAGSKISGRKAGGEESSKLSDRAVSPDAEDDDTTDHTEPGNNNGTIIDQRQGDPHTQNNTTAITPEQAERIARNRQAALERAAERRREQQESSGAVTAAAATAADGVEDRGSGGTSGNRVGCEDGSEPPDEADFPDAGYDDMADYIETGDNDNAIEEEMHGDLHTRDTRDDDHYNNSPHTTTNSTSVDQQQQTLPQDTAATKPTERPPEPKKRKRPTWWPSGDIVEWIKDAKKARPLPHIEIILSNEQRKRKHWQMNSTKAETPHTEHETANDTAQNSDQPANPTRHTRRNKIRTPCYTKRTLDAVTHALDTPRRPDTENETQHNTKTPTDTQHDEEEPAFRDDRVT